MAYGYPYQIQQPVMPSYFNTNYAPPMPQNQQQTSAANVTWIYVNGWIAAREALHLHDKYALILTCCNVSEKLSHLWPVRYRLAGYDLPVYLGDRIVVPHGQFLQCALVSGERFALPASLGFSVRTRLPEVDSI